MHSSLLLRCCSPVLATATSVASSRRHHLVMLRRRQPVVLAAAAAASRYLSSSISSSSSSSSSSHSSSVTHKEFLQNHAQIPPPNELDALLKILEVKGNVIVSPTKRSQLNPFLIPLSQGTIFTPLEEGGSNNNKESVDSDGLLCYLRWPTQRDTMDLQLVRTTDAGVRLISLNTRQYCLREAAELDFYSHPAFSTIHNILKENGIEEYKPKEFQSMLNSGKFPTTTPWDLRLVLDRYLLTKVGPFPDCYERLATTFAENNNEISALVTCERAVSLFSSWGHPLYFHCRMLRKFKREKEVREAATAAMNLPKWTIANSSEELEDSVKMAGFSAMKIVGDMHKFRSTDPRTKDLEEKGLDPKQIPLDQAAHLMDAISLGSVSGGWEAARLELAERYRLGGYPEMADFVAN